jgi:hypothetical protein
MNKAESTSSGTSTGTSSATSTGTSAKSEIGRRIVVAVNDSDASKSSVEWALNNLIDPANDLLVLLNVVTQKPERNITQSMKISGKKRPEKVGIIDIKSVHYPNSAPA